MSGAGSSWRSYFDVALGYLYPIKCPLCGLISDSMPCVACEGEMIPNEPFVTYAEDGPLDFRAALYCYEGRGAQAVRRLKYARSTALAPFMAAEIAKGVEKLGHQGQVVPVPIHWFRWCYRGFNQADLLCRKVDRDRKLLKRIRPTRPQVGLNREQRLKNLRGAFRASPRVHGQSILLIDDVVTSGQTARECARALKEKGAMEVGILAFCGEAGFD